MKHPIQPVILDDGILRFRRNLVVRYLLDTGGLDLNDIGRNDFPKEDLEQFYQLIGCTLSVFGDMPFVSDEVYEAARHMYEEGVPEEKARLEVLQQTLSRLQPIVRSLIEVVFPQLPLDDISDIKKAVPTTNSHDLLCLLIKEQYPTEDLKGFDLNVVYKNTFTEIGAISEAVARIDDYHDPAEHVLNEYLTRLSAPKNHFFVRAVKGTTTLLLLLNSLTETGNRYLESTTVIGK